VFAAFERQLRDEFGIAPLAQTGALVTDIEQDGHRPHGWAHARSGAETVVGSASQIVLPATRRVEGASWSPPLI